MIDSKMKLSISKQCKLLFVSRNCFYYSPKGELEENQIIMDLLKIQYLATPFYGYRKMSVWLEAKGFKVNEKRVRRLMRLANWQTIYRAPRTTIAIKAHKKYPYLLKGLEITHKNQVWATDITYIPMNKGFMYLCAIIDLHTRYVLNWSTSNTMSAQWCAETLQETIDKHGVPEIFNTDQGSQSTSGGNNQFSYTFYDYTSDWNNYGGDNHSSGGGGGGGGGDYYDPNDTNGDGINDADQTQEPPEWSMTDFFDHYNNGNGQTVNLNDMGLRDDVISSDVYLQIMTNVNNQIEALVHAGVAQGNNQPGIYQFTWDFNNSYDFTLTEGLFAIGSATIGGQFSGQYTLDANCNINVQGTLNLNFHDSFEDPWDLINAIPGSWDPTGTPYSIDDNWQQEILMQNIVP